MTCRRLAALVASWRCGARRRRGRAAAGLRTARPGQDWVAGAADAHPGMRVAPGVAKQYRPVCKAAVSVSTRGPLRTPRVTTRRQLNLWSNLWRDHLLGVGARRAGRSGWGDSNSGPPPERLPGGGCVGGLSCGSLGPVVTAGVRCSPLPAAWRVPTVYRRPMDRGERCLDGVHLVSQRWTADTRPNSTTNGGGKDGTQ
jgi:hypothetical protein